jgi:glutaredoxin
MKRQPLLLSSTKNQVAAALLLALLAATGAQAQTVYRIVGPDGKITFSDKPPANADAKTTLAGPGAAAANSGALPYELRQVANKFPVTLYSSDNCGPCGAGRAMLSSRGIPFTERTVSTPEDSQALQRLSGDTSLPLLTIGGQQLKGYSDAEWTQFLDAAGYPKTSALPANYQNGRTSPLITVAPPTPAAPATTAQARAAAPQAPEPARNASNPAGIVF